MAFTKIKNLLKKRIGFHTDTVGESSIERAITCRLDQLTISSEQQYFALLMDNPKEFDELVEEVVVPETWFFRNVAPFYALRDYVSNMGASGVGRVGLKPLKVLSLPCSTGEEPYSIAMALRDEGLGEGEFSIDAMDISKRALTKARRAIYGKHSFREPGLGIQEKYFKKSRSGYQLLPEIKGHVSFSLANVLSDKICPVAEYYDVIFCRNLLIYFSRETQKIILNKLYTLLKKGGVIFVGHAEAAQINKKHFSKLGMQKSFAYRKDSIIPALKSSAVVKQKKGTNSEPVGKLKDIYAQLVEVTKKDLALSEKIKNPSVKRKYNTAKSKVTRKGFGKNSTWQKVEKFIEIAHYDEATIACEALLKNEPEDANGYYYLGLISNLRGSTNVAESLLKKAIYLAPHHQKALGLSAQIAEVRGDNENSEYYRRREQKARKKNSE